MYGAAPVAEFFIFPGEALRHFASQHRLVYFHHVKHTADLVIQAYYLGARFVGCFGRQCDAVGGYRAEKVGECGQQLGIGYLDPQTAGRVLTSPALLAFASAVVSAKHSVAATWASDGDGQLEYVLCFVRVPLCVAPMLRFLYFLIGRLVDDRRIHLCAEVFCIINEVFEPPLVPIGNAVPVFDFLSVQLLGYGQHRGAVKVGGIYLFQYFAFLRFYDDNAVFTAVAVRQGSVFHSVSPSFLWDLLSQCNAADELEGKLFTAVHRDALDDFVKQPVVKLDGRLVFIEDAV